MPPPSVPALFCTRLLAIWRLCPHPCTKIPPPPCELSWMVNPSMLDGLHQKLLAYAPVQYELLLADVNRTVPAGNPASSVGSNGFDGKNTPLERTVMPAPSSAPIRLGSCSSSARFPFKLASQPTVAS